MFKRILSAVTVIMMIFSYVVIAADNDKKEIFETDVEASIMIDAADHNSTYLNVTGPVGTTAEYAEGDFMDDDTNAVWSSVSPRFNDTSLHIVTVKLSGEGYYDTLFSFEIKNDDLNNIISASYDADTQKLSLVSSDPLLSKAYIVHAIYNDAGILVNVNIYKTEFENGESEILNVDFTRGRLFIWKTFDGAGAMFPLCEKINLENID